MSGEQIITHDQVIDLCLRVRRGDLDRETLTHLARFLGAVGAEVQVMTRPQEPRANAAERIAAQYRELLAVSRT